MARILDRSFRYVPSSRQTVEHMRALFAAERKRLEDSKRAAPAVVQIKRVKP